MLTISTAVDIVMQIDNFVVVSEVFQKFSAFEVLMDAIVTQRLQSKLQFSKYGELVYELQKH
jgi:hypothetical protein